MPSYSHSVYSTRSKSGPYGSRNRSRRQNTNRRTKQYINPAKFVQKATIAQAETYQPINSFADFDVAPIIKTNVEAKGFVDPSPIQDQAVPLALAGKDVIGIANTGTGKTAAFAIPVLHKLISARGSKALIVAPTRELAEQIEADLRSIGKGSGLFGVLLIGGKPIGPQLRDLRHNPEIIIGTPGRIKDHLDRRTLKLQDFSTVVLDEVDRMLDMGFIHDIREILSQLGRPRQSLFFSATLDSKIRQLINEFANEPVSISVKTGDSSDSVHQDVVSYGSKGERLDKLHDILLHEDAKKIIVFDETQRSVERLSKELIARGFKADAIHGGKSQGQRQRALSKFKASKINVLVATDVAARGIDVADVTHVVNYSTPQSYEDYIHRVGRAGRAGKVGYALTFVAS